MNVRLMIQGRALQSGIIEESESSKHAKKKKGPLGFRLLGRYSSWATFREVHRSYTGTAKGLFIWP